MDNKHKPDSVLAFGMGMISAALPGFVSIIIMRFIQYYDKPQSMNYVVAVVVYGMGAYLIKVNSEDLGWIFYLGYVIAACVMVLSM